MAPGKPKIDFRDVSLGLRKIREFLLGRKPHNLHVRFPPNIAARSQPPPDIPRSAEVKLADNYYCERSPFATVAPPVEAALAAAPGLAAPASSSATDAIKSKVLRPGQPWGWDTHTYWTIGPVRADPLPPPPPSAPAPSSCDPCCDTPKK